MEHDFALPPRGEKYSAPNVTKFLTITLLHVTWQNIILELVSALTSKHFTLVKQDIRKHY